MKPENALCSAARRIVVTACTVAALCLFSVTSLAQPPKKSAPDETAAKKSAPVTKAVTKPTSPPPKARTALEISRVFRAGTAELSAFTGYAILDSGINLGSDDAPPHYKDNVPGSAPLTGVRLGYNLTEMFAAEVALKQSRTAFVRDNHGVTVISARLNGLAHLNFRDRTLRPFVLVGAGFEKLLQKKELDTDALEAVDADTDFALYAGIGAKYHVTDRLSFRAGGRVILSENAAGSVLAPVGYEAMLGGTINIFVVDQDPDHDGIATSRDQCPAQAEDRDGFEDEDGCPDTDNDHDGIADAVDKCPLEKETLNGVQDEDGCPDQDADGDLIEDRDDKCPNQAEDMDKFEDEDGCPEDDNDKDGIPDAKDKCPNDPEDKDGYMDDDGCPEPDNDGDGIMDAADKCPNKLETHNGFEDDDGCPDTVPKAVSKEFKGTIEGINFGLDSAEINTNSDGVLKRALKVLNTFPGVKIEIGGHTDNSGTVEYNADLSKRRAEAVRQWFIARKVGPSRLVAVGYGRDQPIAPNTSEAGRSKNRRIEFKLLVRTAK